MNKVFIISLILCLVSCSGLTRKGLLIPRYVGKEKSELELDTMKISELNIVGIIIPFIPIFKSGSGVCDLRLELKSVGTMDECPVIEVIGFGYPSKYMVKYKGKLKYSCNYTLHCNDEISVKVHLNEKNSEEWLYTYQSEWNYDW